MAVEIYICANCGHMEKVSVPKGTLGYAVEKYHGKCRWCARRFSDADKVTLTTE